MTLSNQSTRWLPAIAILTAVAIPAQAGAQTQDQAGPGAGHSPQARSPGVIRQAPAQGGQPGGQPHVPIPRQAGPMAGQPQGAQPAAPPRAAVAPQGRPPGASHGYAAGPGPAAIGRGPDARYAHGRVAVRDYGGQSYRGRVGWEGGRWRHEVHNGRPGWWWDVGGVWYYYPEPMEGPPTYVSEDYADDVVYAPSAAYEEPPPVAYEPAPPPPAEVDPGASALGGAIIGGVLGGILTGKAGGAAAGAVLGGATGAIAGATAAARPGYYLSQGNCYYRYPSGEYVAVDPRSCY
ncbi:MULTISPECIES: hypothetical protein [unclassified Bradyrhizobium]|uniref:hypothetical protein n=1 Tax=unclassified Bradyrhizobium TaxID=2631580 RepID=UPI0028EAF206|nr:MULTISPECIES: hypothetical protein [unclassified Bradyrhizobium]